MRNGASMYNKVYIIAEIAQAHEGSLGILHSYIDAVSTTKVDAIKFQTHIAEAESSSYEPFRVKFSYEDKSRYDYWKRMEFNIDQWRGIKKHCEDVGIEFLSSPFSCAAVDLLECVGCSRYKIASGEVNNFLLLDKICRTGKDILLSSGISSLEELDEAIAFIEKFGNQVSLLQCTTMYPTPPEELGLNVINELAERYNIPVGFSDHSGQIYSGLAAVSLGAVILEVHATFDKRMFGPDTTSSLTIDQLSKLVEGVRFLEKAFSQDINKSDNSNFKRLKSIFEKTIAVNKNLSKGSVLTKDDLESKKPAGHGISAKNYDSVIGKTLLVDKTKYDFLTPTDIG